MTSRRLGADLLSVTSLVGWLAGQVISKTLKLRKESDPGKMKNFHTLTQLSGGEDFIEVCRRESFKAYNTAICSVFIKNRDVKRNWREHKKRAKEHISQGSP